MADTSATTAPFPVPIARWAAAWAATGSACAPDHGQECLSRFIYRISVVALKRVPVREPHMQRHDAVQYYYFTKK
jgi:hypothetical protein